MTVISVLTMIDQGAGQNVQPGATNRVGAAQKKADRAEIKRVAEEFQSLFIEMMLKSMRNTVKQDSLTGGGQGEEVYGSLLDREYAMAISRRGGIGLAEMMEKQIIMQQEGAKAPSKVHGAGKTEKGNIEAYHENR